MAFELNTLSSHHKTWGVLNWKKNKKQKKQEIVISFIEGF
jgi:hypothetical protein